jgi:hypothetical protein
MRGADSVKIAGFRKRPCKLVTYQGRSSLPRWAGKYPAHYQGAWSSDGRQRHTSRVLWLVADHRDGFGV